MPPLFRNASARDYRLQAGSPCRRVGNAALLPKNVADLDWDGTTTSTLARDLGMNARVTGPTVNMGAYE